jgi:hypothetical protein
MRVEVMAGGVKGEKIDRGEGGIWRRRWRRRWRRTFQDKCSARLEERWLFLFTTREKAFDLKEF